MLRSRLIDRGLVKPAGNGLVDFVIPGHRARLRVAIYQEDRAHNALPAANTATRQRNEPRR